MNQGRMIVVAWGIIGEGDGPFYVNETPHDGNMSRYGPIPTKALAEALVKERREIYQAVYARHNKGRIDA